ncbi:MAG: hypothetical protein HZC43_10140 [Nitrosomonadales bacterium]|nr:hypothetical protein [Nitrosomonadales bacterium]
MDIEVLKLGFQVLQFLVTGALAVYVYLSNKDKVTNDRIGKLEDDLDLKLDGHGERISALETQTRNSPTHSHLSEIHEKINKVGSDISSLSGEFTGVRNLLNTIHQYLLQGGKQ